MASLQARLQGARYSALGLSSLHSNSSGSDRILLARAGTKSLSGRGRSARPTCLRARRPHHPVAVSATSLPKDAPGQKTSSPQNYPTSEDEGAGGERGFTVAGLRLPELAAATAFAAGLLFMAVAGQLQPSKPAAPQAAVAFASASKAAVAPSNTEQQGPSVPLPPRKGWSWKGRKSQAPAAPSSSADQLATVKITAVPVPLSEWSPPSRVHDSQAQDPSTSTQAAVATQQQQEDQAAAAAVAPQQFVPAPVDALGPAMQVTPRRTWPLGRKDGPPLGVAVLVQPLVEEPQQQAHSALQALQVLDADVDPAAICTRRQFARWMVKAYSSLSRDSSARIIPAMFAEDITDPAYDDVAPKDPDFAAIQGLAETGLIASKLSLRDLGCPRMLQEIKQSRFARRAQAQGGGAAPTARPLPQVDQTAKAGCNSGSFFFPDCALTRQDLISWKVVLDMQLREDGPAPVQEAAYRAQQTAGEKVLKSFMDFSSINSDALQPISMDLGSGRSSVFRTLFGMSRRFDAHKPVTCGQVALALSVGKGDTPEAIRAEMARRRKEEPLRPVATAPQAQQQREALAVKEALPLKEAQAPKEAPPAAGAGARAGAVEAAAFAPAVAAKKPKSRAKPIAVEQPTGILTVKSPEVVQSLDTVEEIRKEADIPPLPQYEEAKAGEPVPVEGDVAQKAPSSTQMSPKHPKATQKPKATKAKRIFPSPAAQLEFPSTSPSYRKAVEVSPESPFAPQKDLPGLGQEAEPAVPEVQEQAPVEAVSKPAPRPLPWGEFGEWMQKASSVTGKAQELIGKTAGEANRMVGRVTMPFSQGAGGPSTTGESVSESSQASDPQVLDVGAADDSLAVVPRIEVQEPQSNLPVGEKQDVAESEAAGGVQTGQQEEPAGAIQVDVESPPVATEDVSNADTQSQGSASAEPQSVMKRFLHVLEGFKAPAK